MAVKKNGTTPAPASNQRYNDKPTSMSPADELAVHEAEIREMKKWFARPRFAGITRLYSPEQVVQHRGTIETEYKVAKVAAEEFYARLRELFERGECITTFGPYSPGQAVMIKRAGIEGIYLGG